jgi:hypothetical protein
VTSREKRMFEGARILNKARTAAACIGKPFNDAVLIICGEGILSFHPDERHRAASIGLARWAEGGYPTVEMGHKFAAALLVSNIAPEMLEDMKAPWRSFAINVPDNLIFLWCEKSKARVPVRQILVLQINDQTGCWSFTAYTDTVIVWQYCPPKDLLVQRWPEDKSQNFEASTMSDLDTYAVSLIGRLIVTTCAAMMIHNMSVPTGPGHAAHATARKKGAEPPQMPSMYKVGRPIKVDFRDHVRAISSGEKDVSQVSVRTFVKGHIRYWPHNKEKIIMIDPYWRGPEDAAILVRPHVIIDKDET